MIYLKKSELTIATFSGWGQDPASLDNITNNIAENTFHTDYFTTPTIEEFFKYLNKRSYDILIGWSLGGQIALRAVHDKIITTKLLILISTPFEFSSDKENTYATTQKEFINFKNKYAKNPDKTLKEFKIAISYNDNKKRKIIEKLKEKKSLYGEYWLDQLGNFSCQKINFKKMPKLIFLHGENDIIVNAKQLNIFKKFVPENTHFEVFENCSHAPHISKEKYIRNIIQKEILCLK